MTGPKRSTPDARETISTPDDEIPEATEDSAGEAENDQAKPGPDPLEQRDRRVEELETDLKRLQAEFENYRKRMEREWSDRVKLAGERVMADILPVLDTFDKALDDAKNNGDAKSLRKGLESIHRQLVQVLQREGLRDIRTDGDFDPFMHEAMMREETEEGRDGRVLEVFQKGYTLGPKVIRTAKVKVSTRKEAEAGGSQCHDHPKSEGTEDEQKETEE